VVRQQGPGVDGERPTLRQRAETGPEVRTVRVLPEDGTPLESPHHHMVEGVRPKVPDAVRKGIQASLTGHGEEDARRI
jgi:hypothetical protein